MKELRYEPHETGCIRDNGRWFWVLGLCLVLYVAMLTGQRTEHPETDAWEHHRAIRVWAQNLSEPGNPTYARDEPSIRYSPYTLILTLIHRATGWDAFHILSGAAVMNTALLVAALWLWLAAYQRQQWAGYALLAMTLFYVQLPGYANTTALADLPWHQVNPSAFVLGLSLLSWAAFKHWGDRGWAPALWVLIAVAGAVGMLSHGMTGLILIGGLGAAALAETGGRRRRMLVGAAVVAVLGLSLAAWWPWYDFLSVIRERRDVWYWFRPEVYRQLIMVWSFPAMIGVLAALPMRDQPLIRMCLWGVLGSAALGVAAGAIKSPTFARAPLAGLIFAQTAIGGFLAFHGTFALRTWPARMRQLFQRDYITAARPLLEVFALVILFYGGMLSAEATLTRPFLARAYIAPLLGKEDKQPRLKERYEQVLAPVGERDVVMADIITGWPVPSFRGRLVGAIHIEYFVPGQRERIEDVLRWFEPGGNEERCKVLKKYGVDWILLNTAHPLQASLVIPEAKASEADGLVLMDARRWCTAQE